MAFYIPFFVTRRPIFKSRRSIFSVRAKLTNSMKLENIYSPADLKPAGELF